MSLIRETGAKYDAGDDGQRCEHVGFNLSLKRPVWVNPKWNMNLHPSRPGGPTGWRAVKHLLAIIVRTKLCLMIVSMDLTAMIIVVSVTRFLVRAWMSSTLWYNVLKVHSVAFPIARQFQHLFEIGDEIDSLKLDKTDSVV